MHNQTSHPDDADNRDKVLIDVADEVTHRLNAGEDVVLDDYLVRFPDHAKQIRELIPTLQTMAQLGHASSGGHAHEQPNNARLEEVLPAGEIGDFRILREVGRGGMGVVYEAEQISLGRRVALKILPYAAMLDPRQLARFKTEAQAAGSLHHGNIVPVFFVGKDRGVHYYAMQFIDGQTLADLVEQLRKTNRPANKLGSIAPTLDAMPSSRRPTPQSLASPSVETGTIAAISTYKSVNSTAFLRSIVQLGIQAADALDHAHERGVLHRDVKPGNLMLDTLGHLWITDFGLARLEGDARMTISGDLIGTLRYMSPEQALAKRVVVDQRTDIYSLGVTLYELLTLQPAYGGSDRQELLRQIAFEEPRPPRRINKAIPPELELIVTKSMAKNPLERYETARELADDLQRFLDDKPITARRPTMFQRTAKWARRHKLLVSSSAVVSVFVLIVLTIASSMLAQKERDGRVMEKSLRIQLQDQNQETTKQLAAGYLDRGRNLCEQGDCASGMLWFARSLRTAPDEAVELKRVIRENLAAWYDRLTPLQNVLQHQAKVRAVAYSPDGSRIASAGGPVVRIWDAKTLEVVGELVGHQEAVSTIVWKPDGSTIVTGGWDETVRVWDANTLEPIGDPIPAPQVKRKGFWILPSPPPVTSERFRNRRLVAGILDIAFHPDGSQFIVGANCPTVRMWDAATLAPVGEPMDHKNGSVASVAYSPDGSQVLTGGMDGVVCVWEVATGKRIGEIDVKAVGSRGVSFTAFSPDGEHIFTGSRGAGHVDRWNAKTFEHLGRLMRPGPPTAGDLSPDGSRLLTASFGEVSARIWDAETGRHIGDILRHRDRVTSLTFSPDGSYALTGSLDGTARVWRSPQSSTVGLAVGPPRMLAFCVAFSPDGSRVVTGANDGVARVWSTETGQLIGEPLEHSDGYVNLVAYSADGSRLAAGGSNGTARLWDAKTLNPIDNVLRHEDRVNSMVFSPNGDLLLTGSADQTARLWNSATGKPIGKPITHNARVTAVAFARGGAQLLTATNDGTVRRWDASTGRLLSTALRDQGRAFISRDGTHIVTQGTDGLSQIWDAENSTVLASIDTKVMALSPDKTRMLGMVDEAEPGASPHGVARFYDVSTGHQIGPPMPFESKMLGAAFSSDGSSIVLVGENSFARILPVPPVTIQADDERISLWIQVITGMELDDGGVSRTLDGPTWHLRRKQLEKRGGPLMP